MTLEEMKLAVCEKLPELIHIHRVYYLDGKEHPHWNINGAIIHWPTEGLQVCHEAERLMFGEQWQDYMKQLSTTCNGWSNAYHATYEQRLEALCRVWFPERFK